MSMPRGGKPKENVLVKRAQVVEVEDSDDSDDSMPGLVDSSEEDDVPIFRADKKRKLQAKRSPAGSQGTSAPLPPLRPGFLTASKRPTEKKNDEDEPPALVTDSDDDEPTTGAAVDPGLLDSIRSAIISAQKDDDSESLPDLVRSSSGKHGQVGMLPMHGRCTFAA